MHCLLSDPRRAGPPCTMSKYAASFPLCKVRQSWQKFAPMCQASEQQFQPTRTFSSFLAFACRDAQRAVCLPAQSPMGGGITTKSCTQNRAMRTSLQLGLPLVQLRLYKGGWHKKSHRLYKHPQQQFPPTRTFSSFLACRDAQQALCLPAQSPMGGRITTKSCTQKRAMRTSLQLGLPLVQLRLYKGGWHIVFYFCEAR